MSLYEGDLAFIPLSQPFPPREKGVATFLVTQTNAASTPTVRID
jgi:hypothetical protein